jgi:hypothetical protein
VNWPKSGPFQGLACTIITVDNGPFENWMVSSTGFDRYVDLYNPQGGPGGTGGWESHWVFDFDDFLQGAGFRNIGISPAVSSSLAGAGERYIISGDEADGTPREVVQSGEWEEIAQHSYGVTSFSLPSWCYISPYQTGWTLQPDINVPAYLPILSVNAGTRAGMSRPYAHHIVQQVSNPNSPLEKIARESRDILRRNGIDPLMGRENLVWAPNVKGVHGRAVQEELLQALRAAEGGGKRNIIEVLRSFGERAAWK